MFLKNLTLKGFKSFADTTSLDLEPGVTVVVSSQALGSDTRVAISDVDGKTAFPSLPAGPYRVEANLPGPTEIELTEVVVSGEPPPCRAIQYSDQQVGDGLETSAGASRPTATARERLPEPQSPAEPLSAMDRPERAG